MGKAIGLVVGLGNPDEKYRQTRHNVGFWFVDALAAEHGGAFRNQSKFSGDVAKIRIGNADVFLLKPMTYMNDSGRAVKACAAYYRIEAPQVLVAHDDIVLPAGAVQLKQGGGHAGHNGIRDVIQHLGQNFVRLRVGIADPQRPARGANFVLSPPAADQRESIERAIQRTLCHFETIVTGDFQTAAAALGE